MSGNDATMETGKGGDGVLRQLAAYGAALERWPDAAGAAEARRRLMADRDFRAQWEGERGLDRALAGWRAEIDRGIARDGAMERVAGGIMARLRPAAGIRWGSLAAAMLLAAFLGGTVQALRPAAQAEPASPVLLDPTLPEIEEPLL